MVAKIVLPLMIGNLTDCCSADVPPDSQQGHADGHQQHKDRLASNETSSSNGQHKRDLESMGSGLKEHKSHDGGGPAFLTGMLPSHFSLTGDEGQPLLSATDFPSILDSEETAIQDI